MNILLTSAGRRTYLVNYFKEALAMAGLEGMVHAANSQVSPAFFAADRQVVTPLIYDKAYIPFLLDYCEKWSIDLLIPLFDIDLPVLAASREAFAAVGTTVVTADSDSVQICNDKWKTYTVLSDRGILTPRSWLDPEAALEAVRNKELSYPLILKPRWGMGSLSIYQADDDQELRILFKKIQREIRQSYLKYEAQEAPGTCVLIQEKICGRELGMDVINDLNGVYRATSVKEKKGMRAGETDGAVTMEIPFLSGLGSSLSGLLRHRGNLDVDILEWEGRYYVLEMNARFGGGYPFSHAAGIHLPYALVMWATGREPDEVYLKARPGIHAQKDIQILVRSHRPQKEGNL